MIQALIAALLLGLDPVMGQYYLDGGGAVLPFIALRFVLQAVLLHLMVRLFWQVSKNGTPPRRPAGVSRWAPWILAAMYSLFIYLYFDVLRYISVPLSMTLIFTYPLFIGVMTGVMGRSRAAWRAICSPLLLAFVGVVLLVSPQDYHAVNTTGVAMAMLCSVTIAAYAMVQEHVMKRGGYDPLRLGMETLTRAVPLTLGMLFVAYGDRLALDMDGLGSDVPRQMVWIMISGIMGAVVQLCIPASVRNLSAARFGLVMNIELVAAVVFSALILGQVVAPLQYAGCAIVIVAVIWAKRR